MTITDRITIAARRGRKIREHTRGERKWRAFKTVLERQRERHLQAMYRALQDESWSEVATAHAQIDALNEALRAWGAMEAQP